MNSIPNCPFCQAETEKSVFAETTNFRAVYNLAPILPGHSLIIPKRHIETLTAFSDAELQEMILFARKVTGLLQRIFTADGFNWSVQDGETAGQSVSHTHLHIVMRYRGDLPDPGDWYPRLEQNESDLLDSADRPKLSREKMDSIVSRLRRAWGEGM